MGGNDGLAQEDEEEVKEHETDKFEAVVIADEQKPVPA